MNQKAYWIWLNRIPGIGPKTIAKLLEKLQTPENIWNQTEDSLIKIEGIGHMLAQQILDKTYRIGNESYLENMQKQQIEMITIQDKQYPNVLRNIYDSPICLFVKGNKELLQKPALAIVGCRQASSYGERIAQYFAYHIAKENVVIISGMAKGIDAASHKGALKAGGSTIAVLGSGPDVIYPKENEILYQTILAKNGLILSEYLPGTPPCKLHFPQRNRIISALAQGLLVVEAKKKSGTWISVDFALEQGKEIFAIPGNVDNPNAEGTNELIKQGAICVTCLEDILPQKQVKKDKSDQVTE